MDIFRNNFYLGTSGLILPVPNKLSYPQEFKEKSRLSYYSFLMNTIEINSTFYNKPKESTVLKWASEVPENFKFTFKLSKEITHSKNLDFDANLIEHFFALISAVDYKRGCVLVQFPPSIEIHHLHRLKLFMKILRENDPKMLWNIAFEFRHLSLYNKKIYELLDSYRIGLIIHDKFELNILPQHNDDLPFVYIRLHGPNGDYKGNYTNEKLSFYSNYIADLLLKGKKVFTYFNNTIGKPFLDLNFLQKDVNHKLQNKLK